MRFLESGINTVCKDCQNYLLWARPKPIVPLHYQETWRSSKRFAFCNTVTFWILLCIGQHDNKYIWVCFNAIASASCWYETKGEISNSEQNASWGCHLIIHWLRNLRTLDSAPLVLPGAALALRSQVTSAWCLHTLYYPCAHIYCVSIEQIHLPSHTKGFVFK